MIGSRLTSEIARVVIGAVHVAEARRQDDPRGEVISGLGQRRKSRQARQRDVHPERARSATPSLHAFTEGRGQGIRRRHPGVEQLRIDARRDHIGAQYASVLERDAGNAVARDDDFAHGCRGLDLNAMSAGGLHHRRADGSHAAERVAPDAFLAVHLAEGVMQHDVGGARRVGARVVADHGVETEQRLHQFAFEPAVKIVGGRFGKQVEQCAHLLHGKPAQRASDAKRAAHFAETALAESFDKVWRRPQHQAAQHVGDGVDLAAEGNVAFGIPGAEFGEFARHAAIAGEQIAAVRCRKEILHAALHDPQPVLVQREVGDDLRVEQADGIGGDGITEAGMEFLRHRRPARHRPALDDPDPQTGAAEIARTGEAVMAGADDDHVMVLHRCGAQTTALIAQACGRRADPNAVRWRKLSRQPLDRGAAARELVLQPLKAAVEVIDAVDDGLALGGERRDDQ